MKTVIMKMLYGIGFLIFLRGFGKFSFFSKTKLPIFKGVVPMGSPAAPLCVCMHTLLVSFYRTPLSIAFEKMYGGIFYPGFWRDKFFIQVFINFLENSPHKSEVLISRSKTGCGQLCCRDDYA